MASEMRRRGPGRAAACRNAAGASLVADIARKGSTSVRRDPRERDRAARSGVRGPATRVEPTDSRRAHQVSTIEPGATLIDRSAPTG